MTSVEADLAYAADVADARECGVDFALLYSAYQVTFCEGPSSNKTLVSCSRYAVMPLEIDVTRCTP